MKNAYLTVFAVFMILAISGFASAFGDTSKTIVSGKVYDEDIVTGPVVSGANVTVTCAGHVLGTTSIADGSYAVVYNTRDCGIGQTVDIAASKDDRSGSTTAVVNDGGMAVLCDVKLNYAVGNVVLIPEFGLTVGMFTIVGALVAFFLIRRD
jgi:hypothetical protein